MHQQLTHTRTTLFLLILLSTLCVGFAVDAAAKKPQTQNQNPFTPKAFVIRYWDRAILNKLPKPSFLLSKASPLSATEAAAFAELAAANTLSKRLPEFCSAAHLLCSPEVSPSLSKHKKDARFAVYNDAQNFTNYGEGKGTIDSFKNYSNGYESKEVNDFRSYSRHSAGHDDSFTAYGERTNVVNHDFHTYGPGAAGGSGDFKEYAKESNVPDLRFTTYSGAAVGRKQTFSSYSEDGNSGDQSFTSYGKHSLGTANDFTSYGTNSNVVGSGFSNYAEKANDVNDTFTNYGVNMNVPEQNFKNYAEGTTYATEKFSNYRDQANVGDDSFTSYAKSSRAGTRVDFNNYGKSFNEGTDSFEGYAKGASPDNAVAFKSYGVNNTFKDYAKQGQSITFSSYTNASSSSSSSHSASDSVSGSLVKKWVEPGKFFREKMLREGTVMPMPDIRDKLPQRSFLPRSILTKLPLASSKRVFSNSSMEKIIDDSLGECERKPSVGETKRCVGSIEDMIDFATSVLGRNVTVRSTENINGSKKNVVLGRVRGVNGGRVTKSVSCHQSLFPYLLYYCHSVPKVRVYEADLMDPDTKAKVNHGVAICHLDTTAWSPTHGAFLALGSGPGRIEVCHWIFENDMTWTTAD